MKVEWVYEASDEYRKVFDYYRLHVGAKYARRFSQKVKKAVDQLKMFPNSGVFREETLLGKHGLRAVFIDHYACLYKVENNVIYIYHFVDARRDYIRQIFGYQE